MKKYVKPVLVFEDLNLTQHIAGTCEIIMNQGNPEVCLGSGDAVGGLIIFANKVACGSNAGGEVVEDKEGYCYYKFEDPFTTFIS